MLADPPPPLPDLPPSRLARLVAALGAVAAAGSHPGRRSRIELAIPVQAAAVLDASATLLSAAAGAEPLRVGAGTGLLADAEGEMIPREGTLAGRALAGTEPVLSPGLSREAAHPMERGMEAGPALAVALPAGDCAAVVLLAARPEGAAPFTAAEADALAVLAAAAGPVLEASRRYAARREVAAPLPAPAPPPARGKGKGAPPERLPAGLIGALRHEMNDPLAVLSGEIQLLRRDGRPSAAQVENTLPALHEASRRLCDLAERLTLLERFPEAGYVNESGGLGVSLAGAAGNGGSPDPGQV